MRVVTVLVVALLAGAVLLSGLAQGVRTPWPTVDFDRGQLPGLLSFSAYPVSDQGRAFLLKSSYAALAAPQVTWILLRQQADDERWTAAEFERKWSLVLWGWQRTLIIFFYPHATALRDARAGGSGNLIRFVLETSTGYREAILGDDLDPSLPQYESTHRRYENYYRLEFDRPAALAPGTEWIRLYVMTINARMYFEWRF